MISAVPIAQTLVEQFEPQQDWLAHDSQIHGIGHLTRVFILQELICSALEAEGMQINRTALRWAAVAHDISRHDDGFDLEHGTRSAEWLRDHLRNDIRAKAIDIAVYAVHWHVPDDDKAPEMTTELAILKDADSLDRVRLGDLNPSYLRTDAARSLVTTAKELYLASQPRNDEGDSETFATVLRGAQELGIVETIQKGKLVA